MRQPSFIPFPAFQSNAVQSSFPRKNSYQKEYKRKPQTGKGASEIFTIVLLRGDSAEILFDRNLEKFQGNEAQIHVWGKLKHDLNSCETFQTFVHRYLKRRRIR